MEIKEKFENELNKFNEVMKQYFEKVPYTAFETLEWSRKAIENDLKEIN